LEHSRTIRSVSRTNQEPGDTRYKETALLLAGKTRKKSGRRVISFSPPFFCQGEIAGRRRRKGGLTRRKGKWKSSRKGHTITPMGKFR